MGSTLYVGKLSTTTNSILKSISFSSACNITGRCCFASSNSRLFPLKNVTVIGAGIMGSAIAQVSAQSGYVVTLVDKNEAMLENATKNIRKSLKRVARKKFPDHSHAESVFMEDTLKRLVSLNTDLSKSVKGADLIIETVSEKADVKKEIFQQMEAHAQSSALFATDTSSVPLSQLARFIRRKDKFAGLHFFNPVQVMKLLELIKMPETSEESMKAFQEFASKLGKTVVVCKDTPGYIANRLLVPYCFEALRMLERGDASMPDIDLAMRLGAGYPMGPFELMDYIGVDNMKYIMDSWHEQFPNDPLFEPSALIDKLVAGGSLGRKSGQGFYKYS